MQNIDQDGYWNDEALLPDHAELSVLSGAGAWITTEAGQRLLDAASGHSCVNLGYANAELIEAAAQSYRRLAYCSPEHRCRPVTELSGKLNQLLGGGYRLRYAATGGGANELAIEIARRYWLHLGQPSRRNILALDRSYHGSTGTASFASGPGILQSPHIDRSPEFLHAASARDVIHGTSRDLSTLQQGLEARIAAAGPETVAAIIVEPVAFAGGVVVPPPGFLEMVAAFARRHGILLIVDEVITGFGRSGRWFGFQHADNVRPDIVTMGKGITSAYFPLAAAAVSEPIYTTFLQPGNAMSKVITMAGHPVGCDVALKVIEIMQRDGLVERVRRNEERHLSRLRRLIELPSVRDVRGLGHMWGLEFDGSYAGRGTESAGDVECRCLAAGLLVLRANNMIRINPPLTATDEDIAFVVETLDAAVRDLAAA
ncbi:aminotransferase family protein [Ancylobacter defluvii]|uniref:Aminotransferase YhxA n=1 Tax=Ancylobacter defluvii TaxID=1282440 RepID=A0A9W6JZL8_9HYPH|nr:aminotransferase class III-fold pyridoxal phosphate-dependent enzyme [Ancylobacter defluvii]MBS7585872.1 aminotransferase class III-fold pyridoxal phosphate-dependent enzyme [Ancylobacter defluvii]GLK84248.1 putative aminotransferase YhxA [Ancylobacter defluvii]